jgi:hypothetical protein
MMKGEIAVRRAANEGMRMNVMTERRPADAAEVCMRREMRDADVAREMRAAADMRREVYAAADMRGEMRSATADMSSEMGSATRMTTWMSAAWMSATLRSGARTCGEGQRKCSRAESQCNF